MVLPGQMRSVWAMDSLVLDTAMSLSIRRVCGRCLSPCLVLCLCQPRHHFCSTAAQVTVMSGGRVAQIMAQEDPGERHNGIGMASGTHSGRIEAEARAAATTASAMATVTTAVPSQMVALPVTPICSDEHHGGCRSC